MKPIKVTYDKQADAMYIYLRQGRVARTHPYSDDVILDFDNAGRILGVEVLLITVADHTGELSGVAREYGLDPSTLEAVSMVQDGQIPRAFGYSGGENGR